MILTAGLLLGSCAKNKTSQRNGQIPIVEASDSTIYIKGKNFEGIVFKPTYKWRRPGEGVKEVEHSILLALPEHKNVEPWQPTIEAITSFEHTLHAYWEEAKTDSLADLNNKITIPYKQIDSLKRQYIGFIDSSGTENIWVNLISGSEPNIDWKKEPIIVDDGGPFKRSFDYNVEKDSITKIFTF